MSAIIRPVRPDDVPEIYRMVRELAAFEGATGAVQSTEDMLRKAFFAAQPAAEAIIAESVDSDGDATALGYAVFYSSFSTWTGQRGLWLDDLYVTPAARGSGAGAALLKALAGIAMDRDCARFEWWVLDWNTAARDFYRSKGAEPQSDRIVHRVSGDALARLAGRG